jgi:hypothetical protein
MTTPNRWAELEELFNAVRGLDVHERESFLRARSPDGELRREIDKLLRVHDQLEASGDDGFPGSLYSQRACALLNNVPE